MTNSELYQWITDPSLLCKSSLQELKQMVDDFPYFHAVRMLYLKNLEVLDDVRLDKELRKMSIHIPDRRRLFLLINSRQSGEIDKQEVRQSATNVNKTEDVIEVVERALTAAAPVPPKAATADYAGWLETNKDDIPVLDGTENRMKHQDLIDSFMENESEHFAKRLGAIAAGEVKNTANDDEQASNDLPEKTSLDDSYFTETLARVYISQKRYDKALEIIRALNLKYPEKNIYFADQIRYLEKIININK